MRCDWNEIVTRAAEIVRSYDTGVTLRQLFYRLVAAMLLANTINAYKGLSRVTAKARRAGEFPALLDRTRVIHRYQTFSSSGQARRWLASIYRRDRTEGQRVRLYVGVEKHGLVEQLQAWFGDLGIPILALGGYSSQTFADEVKADVSVCERGAILLYAGDFDPSGEDIDRDFTARAGCFAKVIRVGLSAEQVERYNLPPAMGKASDARAAGFVARHGKLVQVELDALPPDVLRGLYQEAIDQYWDMSVYERVLEREEEERAALSEEEEQP